MIALGEEEPLAVPLVDPARLTPGEQGEANRIAAVVEAGGLEGLSDDDLALAECLRRTLEGTEDETCLDRTSAWAPGTEHHLRAEAFARLGLVSLVPASELTPAPLLDLDSLGRVGDVLDQMPGPRRCS